MACGDDGGEVVTDGEDVSFVVWTVRVSKEVVYYETRKRELETRLDRSKCGSEHVGREEEGTSSGREEMGAYVAILRRTPDHEDLVTVTDSEVLCRVVGRWVGRGGKSSLTNTTDADILEYILAKLAARIAAKSRTFLIKVKAHRGDPLNEGADDLAEADREMEKEGENSR